MRLLDLFKRKKSVPTAADSLGDWGMSVPASWPVGWWQQGFNVQYGGGKTAIVSACVDAYAQTLASVPAYHWKYDDDDTKEKVRNSSQARVLWKPNNYQTRSDLILNMIEGLMFHGNAYAYGVRNNRNEIASMHLLDPRSTQPYVEPETKTIFYAAGDSPLIENFKPSMMIPQRDILHLRLYTPRHPLVGVSPITNAAMSIAANRAISSQQANFFSNMSRPSGILSTDMKLTKEQMLQLRSAFNEQSKDLNAGGVPILGNNMKWYPMSISNQDAQIVEAFNMTVEDIARAFRVPLPLVNDNRHSTYNNVEQLVSYWLSGGLGFLIDHVENNFDAFFGFNMTNRTEFNVDQLLRTDFMSRVDGYTKAVQHALMSPNEARQRFDGLKKVPHGDKPIVQQQMVPLGWTPPEPKPAEPAAPAPAEPEKALDEDEARGAAIYYLKREMSNG